MPRDQEYGIELASRLTGRYSGLVNAVRFTYDSYIEMDSLDPANPFCIVSPFTYNHDRLGRAIWKESISLSLTLVSAAGPTDALEWVGNWLESWDMILRWSREEPLFGKHKPVAVDTDERYDSDLFHNNRRLVTQATLHYQNVEVI